MVKISPFSVGSGGSIPGQGVKIPHVLWQKQTNKQQKNTHTHQNTKQKQYCNKFNEDFKNNLKKKKNSTNITVSKKESKM